MHDQDWSSVAKKAFAERDEAKKKLKEANEKIRAQKMDRQASLAKAFEEGRIAEACIFPHNSILTRVMSIKAEAEAKGKFITRIDCPASIIELMRNCGSSVFSESSEREKRISGLAGGFTGVEIYLDNDILPIGKKPGRTDEILVRYHMDDMGVPACDVEPASQWPSAKGGFPAAMAEGTEEKGTEKWTEHERVKFGAQALIHSLRTLGVEICDKSLISIIVLAKELGVEPEEVSTCITIPPGYPDSEASKQGRAAGRAIVRMLLAGGLPDGIGQVSAKLKGVDDTGTCYEVSAQVVRPKGTAPKAATMDELHEKQTWLQLHDKQVISTKTLCDKFDIDYKNEMERMGKEAKHIDSLSGGHTAFLEAIIGCQLGKEPPPGAKCECCGSDNVNVSNNAPYPSLAKGQKGQGSIASWRCCDCMASGVIRFFVETEQKPKPSSQT